jgi:hypothetical protein
MKRFIYIIIALVLFSCSQEQDAIPLNFNLSKGDQFENVLVFETLNKNIEENLSISLKYTISCLEKRDSTYVVSFLVKDCNVNMLNLKKNRHISYDSKSPEQSKGIPTRFLKPINYIVGKEVRFIISDRGEVLSNLDKDQILKDQPEIAAFLMMSGATMESSAFFPREVPELDVEFSGDQTNNGKTVTYTLKEYNDTEYLLIADVIIEKSMIIGKINYKMKTNYYLDKVTKVPYNVVSTMVLDLDGTEHKFKMTNVASKI